MTYVSDVLINHGAACTIPHALLTVSTNVIVTSVITFRLVRARRAISKLQVLPPNDTRLYTGPVAILVESALPLSIFGVMAVVWTVFLTHPAYEQSEGIWVCFFLFHGLFYSFCVSSTLQLSQ